MAQVVGSVAAPNIVTVFGTHISSTANDVVGTGLKEVLGAIATLEDSPVIGCDRATAVVGNQQGAPPAGQIQVKTWKPTSAADTTPIAATTFGRKVNWIAFGRL